MKKNFFSTAAIFILLSTANNSYAQMPDGTLALNTPVTAPNAIRSSDADGHLYALTNRAYISPNAVRDFTKSNKLAENARWFKIPDGFMVYYGEKGWPTTIKAGYDLNGNWLYTLKCYDETRLPKEIRARVKCVYYDYTIAWVNEITTDRQTIYLVKMEDKAGFKTIRVCEEEEMMVVEAFTKYTP